MDNFTVLPKLIDAMLKDKAEDNQKLKTEPSNMHRNLAQCIIDEEYKHLLPLFLIFLVITKAFHTITRHIRPQHGVNSIIILCNLYSFHYFMLL